MTVQELIEELQKFPQKMRVGCILGNELAYFSEATDLNEEMWELTNHPVVDGKVTHNTWQEKVLVVRSY